jgi:hypothetical protein
MNHHTGCHQPNRVVTAKYKRGEKCQPYPSVPPPPPLVTSVHTVGKLDAMNPPEQARRVAEAFGHGAELLEHAEGHVVPLDDKAIATYVKVMGAAA